VISVLVTYPAANTVKRSSAGDSVSSISRSVKTVFGMPVTFKGSSVGKSGNFGSIAAIVASRWSCICFAVSCHVDSCLNGAGILEWLKVGGRRRRIKELSLFC
jgi:hypothetical protein